jgi:hypothetical protein
VNKIKGLRRTIKYLKGLDMDKKIIYKEKLDGL